MVEPASEIPAKTPRARDQERISAFITTSVSALVVRPTGPAATEASAPSLTLLDITDLAPASFITSRTKSVASPPIWSPKLPPSSANIAGALQGPRRLAPVRQVITPRPYSAPTMKAAFFTEG